MIGAGFAGVTAARELRARGVRVTVLDDGASAGGRARSDVLDGVTIDTGAQLISGSFTRTLRLLGAARDDGAFDAGTAALHVTAGRDAYVRDGQRHPVQFGSIRSLLGFAGLSVVEKMRLARRIVPLLARQHAALDADAGRLPHSLDERSARAFMASRVGERAAALLVEPPLNGFYALRGAEASAAFFLTLARYGGEGDVLAPANGWSPVLERLLADTTYERETTVTELERDARGLVARARDGRSWRANGIVIATGARAAHALLEPLLARDDPLVAWLGSVELRSTWTLALKLGRPLARDVFGVFPDPTHARVVSASAILGAKRPASSAQGVVLAWPTPGAANDLRDATAERIAMAMLPEIEALVPEVRGNVVRARVYRFDDGTPVPRPGFAADRAHGRELARSLELPIALAGDYLTTPIVEGAVASGEQAARRLAERLTLP